MIWPNVSYEETWETSALMFKNVQHRQQRCERKKQLKNPNFPVAIMNHNTHSFAVNFDWNLPPGNDCFSCIGNYSCKLSPKLMLFLFWYIYLNEIDSKKNVHICHFMWVAIYTRVIHFSELCWGIEIVFNPIAEVRGFTPTILSILNIPIVMRSVQKHCREIKG